MNMLGVSIPRRVALRALVLMGASASAASRLVAQVRRTVTPADLETASVVLDQEFEEERLEVIAPALQRNLDQFQMVRDLEIDDLVEPAVTLDPRWR